MPREVITEERVEPTTTTVATRRGGFYSAANLIYLIFGLLEILLGFRFLFLLLGANSANGFVNFIYTLSRPFGAPFYGIFGEASYGASVFDPATIVAMLVYAVVAWVLVRLLGAASNRPV